ncbi:hypothetical protein EYF80_021964 [Liparis tanakae]|uniref:Uncharacterized protein n=1 Tax=Liparis tanakae TaxID=230148 RepID=A0A4Z2HQA9_9TELE|nr:hypothetical protein EYF80_021964 [Liparis tanakae]
MAEPALLSLASRAVTSSGLDGRQPQGSFGAFCNTMLEANMSVLRTGHTRLLRTACEVGRQHNACHQREEGQQCEQQAGLHRDASCPPACL